MYRYKAHVTDVYDGDTITVDIDLGFGVSMKGQKIRLYGINAPEVRGDEKVAGKETRDVLRDMILDQEIEIQTYVDKYNRDKKGKFGRWLGEIYIKELQTSINQFLIESNLAKPATY